MPLVQVVLFGYALRTDVRDVRLAIVDPAPDALTLRCATASQATPRFRIVTVSAARPTLEPLFQRRRADVAVVLPAGVRATSLARGRRDAAC